MATFHGNSGAVKIGANAVAEVTAFSVQEGIAVADDTAMGDTADTHLTGTTNWSGSITCHWDDTDTNGQVAATIGASIDLNLLPEGAATGAAELNGTATITGVAINVERASVNSRTLTFQGNGALVVGVVA